HPHSRWARHSLPALEKTAPAADGAVKPGRWEFSAQLVIPAAPGAPPQAAVGTPSPGGGGPKTTRIGCITAEKAVPIEFGPQCKLDGSQRDGANISWSMTCTNPRTTVRSDGMAQYRGETMEATMISHLPAGNGA